jgi:hypothetical protein
MDSIERRLIELNEALIKLYTEGESALPNTEQIALTAHKTILESKQSYNSGNNVSISDDDIIIINNTTNNECNELPDEPENPIPDICECCISNTVLVDNTEETENEILYEVLPETTHIGIRNLYSKTRIILPEGSPKLQACPIKTIKLEMGPPIGNRRVTIESADGALIDNDADFILQVPYECVTLIHRGDDWHIINHFQGN